MPIFFAAFVRLYSALLIVVFGSVAALFFDENLLNSLMTASLIGALFLAAATCIFLWKQYKKHILST